ncbi:oligosaccharide flippase family protein [Sulfitobacter sp. 1A15299]|uniref:oligosaccharide flippase family protein n=1 Tax=Sulfitobacter sp. 1A15299 TaxID=3368598 RepID=UPI003746C445
MSIRKNIRLLRAEGSFLRNATGFASIQFLSIFAPLIVTPIFIESLTTKTFGSVMAAHSLANVAVIIVNFGYSWTGTRLIAQTDCATTRKKYLINAWLGQLLILFVVLIAITTFLSMITELILLKYFFAYLIFVFGSILSTNWFFSGLEKMSLLAKINVPARLATIPLAYILVRDPGDDYIAIFILSLPALITGVFSFLWLARSNYVSPRQASKVETIRLLNSEWLMFFVRGIREIFFSSATFIAAIALGSEAAAIYAIADRVKNAILAVGSPITNALYPRMSKIAVNSIWVFKHNLTLFGFSIFGLNLFLYIGVLLFGEQISNFFFSVTNSGFMSCLTILAALPIFVGVNNMTIIQTLVTLNRMIHATILAAGGVVIFLIIFYPLSVSHGLSGFALAILLSEFALCVASLIVAVQQIKQKLMLQGY